MGVQSGLLFDSVLMCDNLPTLSLKAVTRKIGAIYDTGMIDSALRYTFGL